MASNLSTQAETHEIPSLLHQIQLTSANLATDDETAKENSRLQALAAARRLVATLEKPEEVVMRYAFEVLLWPSTISHQQLTR